MSARIAEFPWDDHPMGPLERWPHSLRTAVSLILNSRHPMWIGWGRDMWFLYNDAYLHVLGLAKHPWALGKRAPQVWAEIWDVCGPLADKVFDRGEASFVDDVQLFMDRGGYFEETFYSFSYSPIRNDDGEVAGLFCPSNDVTAKVVGARRLRTLSELAGNAMIEKSTRTACSSAAATLEKNPDDVPFALLYLVENDRVTLRESVRSEDREDIDAMPVVASVLDDAQPRRCMVSGRDSIVLPMAGRADARPLGVLVAGINPARPFDEEHRTFFELVASNAGTAISNARASEEEKRRTETLAEMDRAKTVFFSNISHEFRTPLTLMLGPLDQLSQAADGRERELASTARRNALRLLKLVNTLLEFSRLEAGRSDAVFAPTDLALLTQDIASGFRSAIESAGLRFVVDTPLDQPVFVDRSMWERVLLNLLSNALKFTFSGEIEVSLRRDGDVAALAVRDTGAGIPDHELPALFERFHRVRGAKSRTHEGSGIGLALVHDLVTLHGGTITAESTLGEGTTFLVRLPLGSAHLDPSRIARHDDAVFTSSLDQYLADLAATVRFDAPAEQLVVASAGAREARILLADDNADLREYVTSILAKRYDVVAVSNGREALERLRESSFDLIVSDVMMPVVDGFEFLRAVRSDERLASTPFILLSARAGEESSHEGLMQGADDYIVKPFSSEELRARVYAQLNAASLRKRANADLAASEERFRTLAASLPYIVFEAATDGTATFLSDEFESYTGIAPERAYGTSLQSVIHPDDVARSMSTWLQSMASGEPFTNELRLRGADGRYRWFSVRSMPQRNADGEVVRWTGTIVDVHDQRRAAHEREVLARASENFARQLTLDETLAAVVTFVVPEFADWVQIDLRAEDGRVRTVAMSHRDEDCNRVAKQFVGRVHLNPEGSYGAAYTIRTGATQFLRRIEPEMIRNAVGQDDAEAQMYFALGASSGVVVPLVADRETVGSIGLVYAGSDRVYSEDEIPMLEELGRRAGLAIQRARLFEREHRAAESFQEASLPAALPEVPGVAIDAFYSPGRTEAQVGGDWYDALRVADGRIVISIGDVSGSGLQAAVTMGNMRQVIRGIAQVHADPALMLDAADRALRLEYPDTFATAFVAVVDLISGTLTYASAGHPPPLLRRPDGTIEALSDSGLPLGLRGNWSNAASTTIDIADGASVLLYTDGLTEFTHAPADGEQRVRALLRERDSLDGAHPAANVVRSILGDASPADDIAVLVVTIGTAAQLSNPDRGVLQRWSFDTADMDAVGTARAGFARAFSERGGAIEDVAMAELVFGELVSNTVRYAPGRVDVIADWSAPEPVLHVLDNGPGFRHISMLPPDLLSESGRGLFIVSTITNDFRVSKRASGGSHARAVLRLHSRQLADASSDGFSGSLLHALTESSGILSS